MSEPDNQIPKAPTVKTSAVPLKKETVRITLRPSAPPSEPLAPVAPPPPTAQVPVTPPAVAIPPPAPRVAAGAPTVPLRSAPPPVRPVGPGTVPIGSAPRPTGPLAPPPPVRPASGAPMPPAPVGSKTIPLAQSPGPRPVVPGGAPTAPRMTTKLAGAPATQPLPRATMKLTRTEPLHGGPPTAAISSAPIKTAQFEEDEEEDNEGFFNGVAIVSLVGAIAALFIALLAFQKVTPFTQPPVLKTDSAAVKAWQDGGKSDWKIPAEYNPYSKKLPDESWKNEYNEIKKANHELPILPSKSS